MAFAVESKQIVDGPDMDTPDMNVYSKNVAIQNTADNWRAIDMNWLLFNFCAVMVVTIFLTVACIVHIGIVFEMLDLLKSKDKAEAGKRALAFAGISCFIMGCLLVRGWWLGSMILTLIGN